MHTFVQISLSRVATLGLSLALAACGGGGGSSPDAPQSGIVAGKVLSIDDSSSQLAGVPFVLLETGERTSSAADGTFRLGTPGAGPLTLALGSGASSQVSPLSDDDGPSFDDDEVVVPSLVEGENVRIEVRIRGGRLVEVRTSRSSESRLEAESDLQRAATSDDANIEGKVEVERRPDREKIEFEVDHAAPGRMIEFFLVDGSGAEISQGVATTNATGEAELELSTNDGDSLPLGATRLEELEGRGVIYKDAGSGLVLLTGTIPALPAGIPPGDNPGTGEDGDDDEARARLSGTGGVGGYIEVERDDGEEEFDIEVDGLAPGTAVTYWLETAIGSNTYTQIGQRTAHAGGEAELEFDTDDGDMLPGGAASLNDLAGRRVEIRDSAGASILATGTTPQL